MDDIRYIELRLLRAVAEGTLGRSALGKSVMGERFDVEQELFEDMVQTLLVEGLIRIKALARAVAYATDVPLAKPRGAPSTRELLPAEYLRGQLLGTTHDVRITFAGLRRIEELRERLQRDRILDPLGVLIDARYREPELKLALARAAVPVAFVALDLDGLKGINDQVGHPAGDALLRAYMTAVRSRVGTHGTPMRAGGDEVNIVLAGLAHPEVVVLCESIREDVTLLEVEHEGSRLPRVTVSVGVACAPPAPRSRRLVELAEAAQRAAKGGKDCVVDGSGFE